MSLEAGGKASIVGKVLLSLWGTWGRRAPRNREGCWQLWRMKRVDPGAGCPLGVEERTLKMTLLFLERGESRQRALNPPHLNLLRSANL